MHPHRLYSGGAVDPRPGPHQPAEAGGVAAERGQGQGQEALGAQVTGTKCLYALLYSCFVQLQKEKVHDRR